MKLLFLDILLVHAIIVVTPDTHRLSYDGTLKAKNDAEENH